MAPKKLTESDKQEILDRYRHSDETTITLAGQYGVSTSTISRILKQSLPELEYESLVQRKRQGTGRAQSEQDLLPGIELPVKVEQLSEVEPDLDSEPAPIFTPQRRQRKRSNTGMISAEQLAASVAQLSQLDLAPIRKIDDIELEAASEVKQEIELAPELEPISPVQEAALVASEFPDVDEDDEDEDDLEDDLDDLDDDDLDSLDGDLEDGEFDESSALSSIQIPASGLLRILPLTEAPIPRTCYVVVDRSSELITRPLKDFADLGQVPTPEVQERTLPIFDNHRVAKRFLRRMQRIVKVPDGRVFQKVKPYLEAKGITHLLIDGQIYSLN